MVGRDEIGLEVCKYSRLRAPRRISKPAATGLVQRNDRTVRKVRAELRRNCLAIDEQQSETAGVTALEAARGERGGVEPFAGETQIFIFPGYRIISIDGLVTNFHLPESTLLMLVSAFAGREFVLSAYRHAVEQRYRFYSYGDAMLVWPSQQA